MYSIEELKNAQRCTRKVMGIQAFFVEEGNYDKNTIFTEITQLEIV